MSYIFNGNLCGNLCPDCSEPLYGAEVRLYRLPEIDQDENEKKDIRKATSNPKYTLRILEGGEIEEKEDRLLGKGKMGEDGSFDVPISDKKDYNEEAFEIDVYLESVPGRVSEEKAEPVQIHVTTHQPVWRQREEGSITHWEYCLPQRFWCAVRVRFDAWVVCGTVTSCESELPLSGLEVTAFDADWVEDDALGTAVTDGSGHFRIDYSAAAFRQTPLSPLINVELIGGPDIYFRIESDGSPVLKEERSRGRQADREDSGPCLCVDLCVPIGEEPPVEDPWFTHVGDFHILSDIDHATGRTQHAVLGHGGPDYGFFGNLTLYGFCPKVSPPDSSNPMRYRFVYEDLDNDPGNEIPVTGNLVAPIKVGSRLIQWDLDGSGPDWVFQSIILKKSGATPDPTPTPSVPPGTPWGPVPEHVIVPDSEGWVEVDQDALDGGFATLMKLRTGHIHSPPAAPHDGAGNSVSDPKSGMPVKLIFEAEPISGGPPSFRDELPRLYINNWGEVRQLDLQQFQTSGSSCTPITSDLDILYTVDHELLESWSLTIKSAAFSPQDDLPAPYSNPIRSGSTPRGDADTVHLDVSDNSKWPSCSYKVWLTTQRALTNGEHDDDGDSTLLTFCK